MATKKKDRSKLDLVQIEQGLKVVYPDPDQSTKGPKNYSHDIIAIPGLGAHPEFTWIYKDKEKDKEKVHWLRDSRMLASKLPNARISVLNYRSQWFGFGSIDQRIENVADQLLHEIRRMRSADSKIPIIFICHCLGGIVLEQALLTARLRQNDYPNIFPSVAGCIFLGTPFHGTETQSKALLLAKMAETIGVGYPALVKLLEKDSAALLKMLDEFVRLCNDAQIRVFCFYEALSSDIASVLIKGLPFRTPEVVVNKDSATYPGVDSLELFSDHFQLNKYAGPKDEKFAIVSYEIKVTAQRAKGIIKARQSALRQAQISDTVYTSILDALGSGFSDVPTAINGNYRGPKAGGDPSKTTDQQHADTTKVQSREWIQKLGAYKTWSEDSNAHILWVHGKAGTGQAATASSVIAKLKEPGDQENIVASFFCDQSDENRRSLQGLLRIVIRQIITANQDLAVHFLTDSKKAKKGDSQTFDVESLSKVPVLWNALCAMAKSMSSGTMYLVLYGIEQLSQDSLTEFLRLSTDIMNPSPDDEDDEPLPIKLVLLSRSGRPIIEKSLKDKALTIKMDDPEHAGHISDDLKSEVSLRVDDLGLPSSLGYFVKRYVHSRAEGNTIYVSLALQEIKNAQQSGKASFTEIRTLLESFPYGLADMFEHVRKRVLTPGAEGLEYTKEILRCMVVTLRAPTLRELAIIAGLPVEEREDIEAIKTRLIRCGSFLTLEGNELDEDSNTVEWIDSAAQEHLKINAKDDIGCGTSELEGLQHGIIGLRCLEYIYELTEKSEGDSNDDENADEGGSDHDEHDADDADAASHVADNEEEESTPMDQDEKQDENEEPPDTKVEGEQAEATGTDEEDIDNNPVASVGLNLADENMRYPVQYWIEHVKLAPEDIIEELRTGHAFWRDDSAARQDWWSANDALHYEANQTNVSPLHVAALTGFSLLIDHLLRYGWEANVSDEDSLGYQALYYACAKGHLDIVQSLLGAGADINAFSDEAKVTPLHGAAYEGHIDIIECLLDRDADIDLASDEWGTPLYAAAENGGFETMKLLVSRDAKVNDTGGYYHRPLNVAAYNGNIEAVRLLLEHGADVDPDEEFLYGSALGAAARRGHAEIVKLLLSRGWSPNKTMQTYGSAITAAATYGHVEVVEALVQKEARITILEQALQAASQNGKAAVVQVILQHTPTLRHQKAFMAAAFNGRDEVLKLLHDRGMPQDKLDEALYHATDHEHEETVKLLLSYGADPNAEGKEYGTALTASAYDGTTDILNALLDAGADVNKQGGDYGTALQAAAFYGDSENVKILLDKGAAVNTDNIGIYGNPLQAACQTGDSATVRMLLEHGADVNAHGGKHGYAIIAAADEGDSEVVKMLLEQGADVNVHGGEDNEPLIVIAGMTLPQDDLIAILDKGADINATDDKHTTALINCADAGDKEGLELLLSRGADVHAMSEELGTALHAAAAEGDEDCCDVLVKAGADVNASHDELGTPLQAAATAADLDTIKVLLGAGADIDVVAGEYGSALQAAAYSGDLEVVQVLVDHEATIDHLGGKYGYPLQAAAVGGHTEIMKLLIEHGADVNAEGGFFGSALLAAAATPDSVERVQLLLDHDADASFVGQLGSIAQAAAYGNNLAILEALLEHGADVHSNCGKYGTALQVAALKAGEDFVDALLEKSVDVNDRGGKYDTAIQAAASADKLDIVNKLLDHDADYKFKGGLYGNAMNAAAIRGNKDILARLIGLQPPEDMLDEALVESCYHRKASSVEALLKAGGNVYTRHPTLGTPNEALAADAPNDYNSDDEHEDDGDEEEEEEEDEDDDEDEEQWEGDDTASVAADTEGSVTNLELEEELSDDVKIQKLLDEAMARAKRNPNMSRFRSVKRKALPASLTAGPPPVQSSTTAYTQFDPPPSQPQPYIHSYQQQGFGAETAQPQFQAYPGSNQYGNAATPQSAPSHRQSYIPYRNSVSGVPQPPPTQYQATSPPAPVQQYSTAPPGYANTPPLPPRHPSQDSARYSTQYGSPGFPVQPNQPQQRPSYTNLQSQYNSPPTQSPYEDHGYGASQYTSPPSSAYNTPPALPPRQYTGGQETGYVAYGTGQGSQNSSQTSFQSSQYPQSTQYGGSQGGQGWNGGYGTANTSQSSGFAGQGQQGWK